MDAGICGWKVDRIKIKTRETQLTWRKSQKAVREQVPRNVGRCVMLKQRDGGRRISRIARMGASGAGGGLSVISRPRWIGSVCRT